MSECLVNDTDFKKHWPQVRDRVWYWARRAGERSHLKRGMIVQTDGTMARVRLDLASQRGKLVSIQSVEVKRLHREEDPPFTDDAGGTTIRPE